jgi:hypothetical protein
MLHHVPEAAGVEMRVDERFTARQYRPRRHAVRLQPMHRLVVRVCLCPGRQETIELILVLTAGEESGKPWILSQGRLAEGAAQAVPLRVRPHRDGQPHILALAGIDALGHVQRMAVPRRLRHPPGEGIVHQCLPEQEGCDFALRQVDKRPLPGLAPAGNGPPGPGNRGQSQSYTTMRPGTLPGSPDTARDTTQAEEMVTCARNSA